MTVGRTRLTIREARKLGLTIRKLAPIVRELKAQPDFEELSYSDLAMQVGEHLVQNERPMLNAMAEAGIDFNAIIEFIERIMPLILLLLKFLPLFL